MTKNICIGCNGQIKENYNPLPTDKPSARIICDHCRTLIDTVNVEAQYNEFMKNFKGIVICQ